MVKRGSNVRAGFYNRESVSIYIGIGAVRVAGREVGDARRETRDGRGP